MKDQALIMLKNSVVFAIGLALYSMGNWISINENIILVLSYYDPMTVVKASWLLGAVWIIGSFLLFKAGKNIIKDILGKKFRFTMA